MMMLKNYSELSEALRARADDIDRAVSRNKDDVEANQFGEIELMREAASAIDDLQKFGTEDKVLFNAIVQRRQLLEQSKTARAELAEVEALIFDHYQPKN